MEWQRNWLLSKLHEGIADPENLPESEIYCSRWKDVIRELRESGDIERKGKLALTPQGRSRIEEVLLLNRGRFPDLSPSGKEFPFTVHVAPIGSGSKVIEDENVFGFVTGFMRKTLGLEMEAAVLGVTPRVLVDLAILGELRKCLAVDPTEDRVEEGARELLGRVVLVVRPGGPARHVRPEDDRRDRRPRRGHRLASARRR